MTLDLSLIPSSDIISYPPLSHGKKTSLFRLVPAVSFLFHNSVRASVSLFIFYYCDSVEKQLCWSCVVTGLAWAWARGAS